MEFVTIVKTVKLFRLALGLVPNIPDKKSEASAEPADIILRWAPQHITQERHENVLSFTYVLMLDSWAEKKSFFLKRQCT